MDGRLAAVLAALEAEKTSAPILNQYERLVFRRDTRRYSHATADITGTTTTQLHRVLLGVLSKELIKRRKEDKVGFEHIQAAQRQRAQWREHRG